MLTRHAIEEEYTTKDGIIQDPGKFEGEPVYAVYFWNSGLEGGADEEDGPLCGFTVTDEDRKEFPELAGVGSVWLDESEQGFIYTTTDPRSAQEAAPSYRGNAEDEDNN